MVLLCAIIYLSVNCTLKVPFWSCLAISAPFMVLLARDLYISFLKYWCVWFILKRIMPYSLQSVCVQCSHCNITTTHSLKVSLAIGKRFIKLIQRMNVCILTESTECLVLIAHTQKSDGFQSWLWNIWQCVNFPFLYYVFYFPCQWNMSPHGYNVQLL